MARPKRIPTCHPDRPHGAHGLCKTCYANKRYADPVIRAAVLGRAKLFYVNNPERVKARAKSYYYQNREATIDAAWERELWKKYKLHRHEYMAMFEAQGGVCHICKCVSPTRLLVDHCHATGHIRGLLCARCNWGLGMYEDDPMRLRAAAEYLERAIRAREAA